MTQPSSSEVVAERPSDSLIIVGKDWNPEQVRIHDIRRTANGVVLGSPNWVQPLGARQISIKWLFVFLGACFLLSWFVALSGEPGLLFSAMVSPWVLHGMHVWGDRRRQKSRDRLRQAATAAHADERLRAYVHSDDTAEIESMSDVPFEPVVIHRARLSPKARYGYLVGIPASIVLIFMLRPILPFHWMYLLWFIVLPSATIVYCIYPHANPWYYRITPGRMDLIRFEPFRRRRAGTILREWNLRDAWIELFDHVVTIRPTRESAEAFHIKVNELAEPQTFVYALFRGAISTHEAPALPIDRLV
ncbi:MAG: hypothetical protein H6819_00055 [Phycisphaerales bacterium]|nr:hypothetical protein [Phycisphaerales bacterium]MCB9857401.1 hypothetical protein [Phycisphaerales bacterium]